MNAPLKLPKLKKCKVCPEKFIPFSTTQQVCSPACAIKHVEAVKAKKARIEYRDAKEKMKTRQQWLKEVQVEFNKFIRTRDSGKPCICCGMPLVENAIGGGFDCGHYRSVGSAPHLRFDERNAHGQRKQCNRWGSGRAVDYRAGLINRIGIEAVDALEADQEPKHYTIDELKALKAEYKRKCKEIEKEMNHG